MFIIGGTLKSRRVLYLAAYFIYSENQWSIQAPQPHEHVRISRAMMMSHTTSLPKRSQRQFIVVFLSSFIISDRNPLWSGFCSHSNIIVCSGDSLCAWGWDCPSQNRFHVFSFLRSMVEILYCKNLFWIYKKGLKNYWWWIIIRSRAMQM